MREKLLFRSGFPNVACENELSYSCPFFVGNLGTAVAQFPFDFRKSQEAR